jgi:SAM-dependent methyltransferase
MPEADRLKRWPAAKSAARVIRRLQGRVRRAKAVRWVLTRGYTSGLVALGERNTYLVPGRWITVDWVGADVSTDLRSGGHLPFADESQRFVYSAHLVEHLDDDSMLCLFAECRRILRPDGLLRVETVDAERLVRAYREGDGSFFDYFVWGYRQYAVERVGLPASVLEPHNVLVGELSSYIDSRAEPGGHLPVLVSRSEVDRRLEELDLDGFGRWCVSLQSADQYTSGGHVNCLYLGKLERMLTEAGFSNVMRVQSGESVGGFPLSGIERPHRAFYSVLVEAQR